MALVFQTWTLCIYYDVHCTLLHKRKTAIFANNKQQQRVSPQTRLMEPPTAVEVSKKRHCVIKVQHTHTRFFINSTTGTRAKRKKLLFSLKMRSKEDQKRRKLHFLPRRKAYAYDLKATLHRHVTHAIRGRTEWRHVS